MSDAKHEGYVGPNDPAYYAPREQRERTSSEQPGKMPIQTEEWRPRLTTEGPPLQPFGKPPRRQDEMFTKAVAQAMQEARDMAPVEAPSVLRDLSGRRALLQQVIRFSIAVAIAASIATLLVMAIPASQRPAGQDTASLAAIWQSVKSSVLPAPQPTQPKRTATLAVQDGSGFANDPVPLGIHVGAPPPGAFVSINGLTAGARLTSGKRIGSNEWRVPATEISGVSVIPPDGFTGQMLVTAELRDGDGVALTGTSTRLTWAAAPGATAAPRASAAPRVSAAPSAAAVPSAAAAPRAAAPSPVAVAPPPVVLAPPPVAAPPPVTVAAATPPAAPVPPPQAEVVRSLDPREIATLVKRGQDLLASGDVQSARLLLLRGAEARDARAALLVGTTYDPVLLRQIGADGPLADAAQARLWYQRAKEWGEPDAQRKLDALALSR
ncbi:hypothetical protein IVB30_29395 [Bradyrhizobium sp. 200]|uniref:hypothetical protein n=1 Tax=Bradyrhizobium sp. 200 TaxID=2782665 RepID=UPI001FFE7A3D|nr:hypothetical protein [Bradyrhizobium sp. 200]UPJ47365.1 hypothetical protein IVB30_29395 [Bradyrhizobium sp. 200]